MFPLRRLLSVFGRNKRQPPAAATSKELLAFSPPGSNLLDFSQRVNDLQQRELLCRVLEKRSASGNILHHSNESISSTPTLLFEPPIYLSVYLSISLSLHRSIYLSIYLPDSSGQTKQASERASEQSARPSLKSSSASKTSLRSLV